MTNAPVDGAGATRLTVIVTTLVLPPTVDD